LSIEGEQIYPAAGGAHSGVLGAAVAPTQGMIAFADDDTTPFEKAEDGQCLVRMQRVGALLLVEDNMQCGGSMVTSLSPRVERPRTAIATSGACYLSSRGGWLKARPIPPNSPLLAKRGTKRCVCHSGKRFQPGAMDTSRRRVKPVRIQYNIC
jgi:hypothetical protein